MAASFTIHDVVSIELVMSNINNSNSRTVRVETKDGQWFDLSFFGQTDALEALPKSETFRRFDRKPVSDAGVAA